MEDESASFAIVAFIVVFYLFPFIVALCKCHKQTIAILLLNLLLGWTAIGWIIALIWAASNDKSNTVVINKEPVSSADEIQKLAELKEKGLLTEAEFNAKKVQILGL